MRLKQSVLIFLVLMLFTFMGFVQAAQIEKGPYLIYEGDNTTMTVLWQLDATDTCTLEWGTDTTYSTGSVQTTEYGSDHQHKYEIPNLNTSTKYYYRVSFGSSSYMGSFRSAPPASAQDLKFFAYGDTRSNPGNHDDVANQIINTYTGDGAYQTIALHVGDWINSDTESDWTNQFFPRSYANIIEMQSELPLQGCIGNHEGSGNVYEKYYPYPYVGTRFYWSFDYGPIHVAVIDQYSSYSSGSTQYNWLENDLASTGKKWIFLLFHEPGWSAGGHSNNTTAQNTIQPLCTQYGVDIVFTGHNHYYARCVVEDIQHVTTGGGGAPLYSPSSSYPYVVETAETYHHCEIDIQGNQLNFVARNSNGAVIDSFTLTDNSGPQPPVAQFTASSTVISVGQSVTFTDQSSNNPTSWDWTFEGGIPSGSTAQHPTVTYNTAGTYDVVLSVSNSAGSDTETKTNYITVTAPQPPVANFTASSTSISVGESVTFTDQSTNSPTSWEWTFDGGTPGSSTTQNPTVTYNTVGIYTVTITVCNAQGCDTETKTNYINVSDKPYCTSSGNDQGYEYIAGVEVGDLNNTSGASPYTDFTNLVAHLTQGGTFSVSLTPGFVSGSYTEYWKIRIDYNGDHDFEDTGEEVFSGNSSSTVTGSFTVPAAAPTGDTRMRVSMRYNNAPPVCGSFDYGEVEDYTVNISGVGPQYTLTTNTVGQGSITLNPTGGTYPEGTVVTLTANPASGWQFDSWSGDLSGSTNPVTITMNSNKNATATFSETPVPQYLLTVNTVGQGSVTLNPPGGTYDEGTVVTLTANPASGWKFDNWSGDLTGSTNPDTITMNANKTVTANFSEMGNCTETVGHTTVFGTSTTTANRRAMPFTMPENGEICSVTMYHASGSGNMILGVYDGTGSAPQNRLGVTASTTVSGSTGWQTIDLTSPAFAASGSTVWLAWVYESNPGIYYESGSPGRADAGEGWSGGMPDPFGSSTTANYTYSIYANYTPGAPPQYTLTTNVVGNGTVTLNPAGGTYDAGTVVTVTATPDSGWQFDNWSGDLSGSTNPDTITMNSNKSVTANFSEVGLTGTVGITTVYGSTSTANNRRAMPFTMPEDGEIISVTMYHTGGSGNMILGVYDGASSPQNRLAVTNSTAVSGSTGWQTINLTGSAFVSNGSTVWLAWVYQSNPGIRYQTGSPGRYQSTQTWSGGMPDPFGSGSQTNYLYSIYATYNK